MKAKLKTAKTATKRDVLNTLKQHRTNVSELACRTTQNPDLLEYLQSYASALDAMIDWVAAGGRIRLTVGWQPRLPDFETDDSQYADIQDFPF